MQIRHVALGVASLAVLMGCASTETVPADVEPPTKSVATDAVTADAAAPEPLLIAELTATTVTIERLQEHPGIAARGDIEGFEDTQDSGADADSDAPTAHLDVLPFPDLMKTCPRMTIHNRPEEDAEAVITIYHKIAVINTVPIALAPLSEGCFSSGFGARSGHLHKGIDYHHNVATEIFAAGSGTIAEALYRDDYGRMILIDHGHGVFTRYAHLETFADEIAIGEPIIAGQIIGMMGNTASYPIPRHLHYEVLIGDYNTPKKSFGLDAIDIYTH